MPPRSNKTTLADGLLRDLAERGLTTLYVGASLEVARRNGRNAVYACGFAAALTGRSFDAIVLDDAAKMDTHGYLPRFVMWLQPKGAIFCIESRHGRDDLTGTLTKMFPESRSLRIPAVAGEPEQSFWPEYYPLKDLLRTRDAVGPDVWAAAYQQNPS